MTPMERTTRRQSNARIFSRGKAREVIVELGPPGHFITFRLKGERRRHTLPIDYLYRLAVRATVEQDKRDKREARKRAKELYA